MKKDILVTTLSIIVVLCLVVFSYALYLHFKDDTSGQNSDTATVTREEALAEARSYQPADGTMCTTVMTPARHIESGAEYTFTSGCIPNGWEKTDSGTLQQSKE